MKNTIYIKRKNKILIPSGSSQLPPKQFIALTHNIQTIGFTLSSKLANRIHSLSTQQAEDLHLDLIPALRKATGSYCHLKPLFPNFPHDVRSIPKQALQELNQIHYWEQELQSQLMPEFIKLPPTPSKETPTLTTIDLGSEDDFLLIFKNLLALKTTFSQEDKDHIAWFIKNYSNQIEHHLPSAFPHKENFAFIAIQLLLHYSKASGIISKYTKTPTDILRLATALSGGDISLAENTRFRNFSRKERKAILHLIEQSNLNLEDFYRHHKRWIRLGEKLHPGEYHKQFPKTAHTFKTIRNEKPKNLFNQTTEELLRTGDALKATSHLAHRPTELARKLDHLLRLALDRSPILQIFKTTAPKVPTTTLLQLLGHFKKRHLKKDSRILFPKGNVSKAQVIDNAPEPLNPNICNTIIQIIEETLTQRFTSLDPLGNVYLDPELKNYTIPLSQRAASKSLITYAPGSRIALPQSTNLRFFLWWKEGLINNTPTGRVDVDLSATLCDKNWKCIRHIYYGNLKSDSLEAYHSGDITEAPNGAAEFIDINLNSAYKNNIHYIILFINSYTHHPYCNLPECFTGWITQKNLSQGDTFNPQHVQNKIDITANTKIAIPLIVDLHNHQVIWTDLALKNNPLLHNNVANNEKSALPMIRAFTHHHKPNLYDLFHLHAQARGTLVDHPKNADTVFSLNSGITPSHTEVIQSQFL